MSLIAGRDTAASLAGRAFCGDSDPNCNLGDHHTFVKVQVIYIIVATVVFFLGSGLSIFLIVRQRRKWRQQREKMGVAEVANAPVYDPSVGRPSPNVWAQGAPQPAPPLPPTYSHV